MSACLHIINEVLQYELDRYCPSLDYFTILLFLGVQCALIAIESFLQKPFFGFLFYKNRPKGALLQTLKKQTPEH
jgi:hypothetical protein